MTSSAVFAKRHQEFLQKIGSGVALLLGRTRTAEDDLGLYPKKQESDFFYLTGVEQPNAATIFSTTKPHFTLFIEPPNPEREKWTGKMLSLIEAKRLFCADLVLPIADLEKQCLEVFGKHDTVWYTLGSSERGGLLIRQTFNALKHSVRDGVRAPTTIHNPSVVIAELRLKKSREELAAMRKAQTITAEAFTAAMRAAKPGKFEYEVVAELEAMFRRRGVVRPAYQPIVCSGPKTCILHCPTYDRKLRAGDLLLIDAGAEWEGYAADVTRTIPVSGKFSKPQRLIYDVVLAAQEAVIAKVRPWMKFDELEQTACATLLDGLLRHKVVEASPRPNKRHPELATPTAVAGAPLEAVVEGSQAISASSLDSARDDTSRHFPHKIGHWLGLEVHDVGSYRNRDGNWRVLEPGMVLTVEPGLYFPKASKGVNREFQDIGIRIEDDLLVTKTGHEVLSKVIPKKPLELERLLRRKR